MTKAAFELSVLLLRLQNFNERVCQTHCLRTAPTSYRPIHPRRLEEQLRVTASAAVAIQPAQPTFAAQPQVANT